MTPAIPPPISEEPRIDSLRLSVARLARRLRRRSGVDLSPSQMSALTTLARHGTIRMGRLSELEQISKSSVTRTAAKLEQLGLVERTVDETDARSWNVTLTTKGRDLLTTSNRLVDEYLARQLAVLSAEDREQILAALPALERLLAIRA